MPRRLPPPRTTKERATEPGPIFAFDSDAFRGDAEVPQGLCDAMLCLAFSTREPIAEEALGLRVCADRISGRRAYSTVTTLVGPSGPTPDHEPIGINFGGPNEPQTSHITAVGKSGRMRTVNASARGPLAQLVRASAF